MADRRVIETTLAGKETISPAAKKAGQAIDDLGDEFRDTARDAKRLDDEIEDLNRSLVGLAAAYAASGDKNIFGNIRKQQGELRKSMNARKILQGAGEDGATGFVAGLSAKVGPLLAKVPLGPPLVVAAAVAAPLIGATISAGVIAGLAGGTVAAGIAVAFRDPKIKAEAQSLGQAVGGELDSAFESFRPATLGAFRVVRSELAKMRPELRAIGDEAARFTLPLTRGVTGLVRGALPGIRSGLQDAEPVVRALERGMVRMGKAAGDAVKLIAGGSEAASLALGDVMVAAEVSLKLLSLTVRGLTEAYKYSVPVLGRLVLEQLKGEESAGDFGAGLEKLKTELFGVGGAAAYTADPIGLLAEEIDAMTTAAQTAFGATTNLGEAIDNANAAAKRNGKTLSENTEKGRDNRQQLEALATATKESTKATLAKTHSETEAEAVMQRGYRAFVRAARAMGLSKSAAHALAREMGLVPKDTKTDHKSNAERTKARVEALRRKMNEIPASKTTTYRPVNFNFAVSKAHELRMAINRIPRFVSVGVRVSADGKVRIPGGGGYTFERWGGAYERAQHGLLRDAQVYSARSTGRYMIAEQATGGEAFVPKRGNRARSMSILSEAASWYGASVTPGGRGGGTTVYVQAGYIVTPQQLRDEITRVLNDLKRRGRN